MNETVNVDEAISKGHKMVTYPAIVIVVGIIGVTIYLGAERLIAAWGVPIGFLLSIGLSWLWWSIMITKWRIWAFHNVRNVHELKKRAIQEKLIWADNSIFESTEIRTSTDKAKLIELQNKFNQEDLFLDDLTIPNETIIYYAKRRNFIEMSLMLAILGLGMYLLNTSNDPFLGAFIAMLGALLSFKEYKEATNTKPQIIINDKGIKTINTDFYPWNDIENEEAISQGTGKYTHYYLTYHHPGGQERLRIDEFETNMRSLNKLLILYRGRSKNKTTNS
ncbi:MAG: hypothetical protein RL660_1755 [Bacteroidota bacterium]|jgi:hypothetical protein